MCPDELKTTDLNLLFKVCICEPAPKPLDTINVHFHLDESEESTEGKNILSPNFEVCSLASKTVAMFNNKI